MEPMNTVVRSTVTAAAAISAALLEEVKQRDPLFRADVERAIAAGGTLELSVRFAETNFEIALGVRGPNGKTSDVANIITPTMTTN